MTLTQPAFCQALFVVLALQLSAPSAAAQSVIVVDDQPGPGVDFTDLQPAVVAAPEGSVLLVQAGQYSSFFVSGKSLTVIAEADAVVQVRGGFSVRNLGPGQTFTARGIDVIQPLEEGGYFRLNEGPIWIEDCLLPGRPGDNPLFGVFEQSHAGALVWESATVVFSRCRFVGGFGPILKDEDFQSFPGDGSSGLTVREGQVSLLDCECLGGSGGSVFDTVPYDGGTAGAGLRIEAGTVWASGCEFTGANGGTGDESIFSGCGNGGAGGDAVEQIFSASGTSVFAHQGCGFESGVGGFAGGSGCSDGADGVAIDAAGGSALPLAGTPRTLRASAPVREGDPVELRVQGELGDVALLGYSTGVSPLLLPEFTGQLLLELPVPSIVLGSLAAPGEQLFSVPAPTFADPGLQSLQLFTQSLHLEAPMAAAWLGHGSAVVVLDGAL